MGAVVVVVGHVHDWQKDVGAVKPEQPAQELQATNTACRMCERCGAIKFEQQAQELRGRPRGGGGGRVREHELIFFLFFEKCTHPPRNL